MFVKSVCLIGGMLTQKKNWQAGLILLREEDKRTRDDTIFGQAVKKLLKDAVYHSFFYDISVKGTRLWWVCRMTVVTE